MRPVNNVAGGSVQRSRLLERLLNSRPNLNNGTVAGGLGYALQQGIQGLNANRMMQAEEAQQQQETDAMSAMARGMSAQQWTPPDAEIAMGPSGSAKGDVMIPREAAMKNAAPAGGYDGAIYATGQLGTPAGGRLTNQLLMGKMERDMSVADRDAQRAYESAIRQEDRSFDQQQMDRRFQQQESMFERQQAAARAQQEAQFAQQQQMLQAKLGAQAGQPVGAPFEARDANGQPVLAQRYGDGSVRPVEGFGPSGPTPVAGRDVPLPDEVARQKREIAAAAGGFNDGQGKAAGFADRMFVADQALGQFSQAGMDMWTKAKANVPGVGNYLTSPEYQQFDQAKRDFINAILRRESGAVISDAEFDNAERQYIPQPGDTSEVLAQKARNRAIATASIARAAGPNYDVQPAYGDPAANFGTQANPLVPTSAQDIETAPPGTIMRTPKRGLVQKQPDGSWAPLQGSPSPANAMEQGQSLGVR